MKDREHEVNLSLDKMFKPVSEPLKILANSKRFIENNIKHDENVSESSTSMTSDVNYDSPSTKFEDFHDADTFTFFKFS